MVQQETAPGSLFEDRPGVFAANLVAVMVVLLSREFRSCERHNGQEEDDTKFLQAKREERNGNRRLAISFWRPLPHTVSASLALSSLML